MTCREKLAIEHPTHVREYFIGGCNGCPCDYGYASIPRYCSKGEQSKNICDRCWDREIEENKDEKEKNMTVEELVKVLDKSNSFEIRESYNQSIVVDSNDWSEDNYKTQYEKVKKRTVVQVSSFDSREITIYV